MIHCSQYWHSGWLQGICYACNVEGTEYAPPHSRTLTSVLFTEQYACPRERNGRCENSSILYMKAVLLYTNLVTRDGAISLMLDNPHVSRAWGADVTAILAGSLCLCTCNNDAALESSPEVPSDDSSMYCFLTEEPWLKGLFGRVCKSAKNDC